jgi:methanogenic corrinoid protein MtbC1
LDPLACINEGLTPGINRVGELLASGEYFAPDLIIGGEALKAALAILEPALAGDQEREVLAWVVLGTVEGDLHGIGKTLVVTGWLIVSLVVALRCFRLGNLPGPGASASGGYPSIRH